MGTHMETISVNFSIVVDVGTPMETIKWILANMFAGSNAYSNILIIFNLSVRATSFRAAKWENEGPIETVHPFDERDRLYNLRETHCRHFSIALKQCAKMIISIRFHSRISSHGVPGNGSNTSAISSVINDDYERHTRIN